MELMSRLTGRTRFPNVSLRLVCPGVVC
jgi:hypothetical protein